MKSIARPILTVARPRALGLAAAALAACGAALASTSAQAGYSFQVINDPADIPPPPGADGVTFTNLMGINKSDLIAGFYGSGAAGDPNTGFLLTLPSSVHPRELSWDAANPNYRAKRYRHRDGVHVSDKLGGALRFPVRLLRAGRGVHHGQQPRDPRLWRSRSLRSRGDHRKPVDRRERQGSRSRLL